jgi:hypothetical protein
MAIRKSLLHMKLRRFDPTTDGVFGHNFLAVANVKNEIFAALN